MTLLISKQKTNLNSGHGIIGRDAIVIFADVMMSAFGRGMELLE